MGSLADVLYQPPKSRIRSTVGADPAANLTNAIYGAWQRHHQSPPNLTMDHTPATQADGLTPPDAAAPPDADPAAYSQDVENGDDMPQYGSGAMVTKPTVALIAEKGPEMVVPLTDQPGQKVPSSVLGVSAMRTRSRHVTGPNALGHRSPIRTDLPLIPNKGVR